MAQNGKRLSVHREPGNQANPFGNRRMGECREYLRTTGNECRVDLGLQGNVINAGLAIDEAGHQGGLHTDIERLRAAGDEVQQSTRWG